MAIIVVYMVIMLLYSIWDLKNYFVTVNGLMNGMNAYVVTAHIAVIKDGIVIDHLPQTLCAFAPCFFKEVEHNMQCHRNKEIYSTALLQEGLKIFIII